MLAKTTRHERATDLHSRVEPWKNAKRGQTCEQPIGHCKGQQACEKCSPAAEDDGIRSNPIEKIALVITHFLVEMASGKYQAKKEAEKKAI